MQDILDQLRNWVDEGQSIALATVVKTWGSSPRAEGARMVVRDDGLMAGSVSGGCVEGAVVEEALEVLRTGHTRLLKYGVSDETAWDVGLACGGSIEIFVQPFDPTFMDSLDAIVEMRTALVEAIVIHGSESLVGHSALFTNEGHLAGEWPKELQKEVQSLARETLETGSARQVELEADGEAVGVFLDPLLPKPSLIMIGGVHISIALSDLAQTLGYRTIVIDPRKSFADEARFPAVDQMIQRWPEEGLSEVGIDANTAIAVLTHDPKIDDPALLTALRSPAFYVGALGSRTTHAKRVERLRNQGMKTERLDRLRAPIGLDLGGRTPEEIAVSILAEIIAARHGNLAIKD